MGKFNEFQEVRVGKLDQPLKGRFLSSSFEPPRTPEVGQTGIIVSVNPSHYLVERGDSAGYAEWLCEFEESELEAVKQRG